ncbi:MAG: histidine phosphatase family protein [Thalassobaculales bacterium]
MRRICLLRHAKSDWSQPGLADFDRPLAPRGRRAIAGLGAWLAALGPPPDEVLVSAARRTVDTWEGLRPLLGGVPDLHVERGLYLADGARLLERLRRLDEGAGSVLLIAHSPGIEELAGLLAGPQAAEAAGWTRKFPTAACAVLETAAPWPALAAGSARLLAYRRPRDGEPPAAP